MCSILFCLFSRQRWQTNNTPVISTRKLSIFTILSLSLDILTPNFSTCCFKKIFYFIAMYFLLLNLLLDVRVFWGVVRNISNKKSTQHLFVNEILIREQDNFIKRPTWTSSIDLPYSTIRLSTETHERSTHTTINQLD